MKVIGLLAVLNLFFLLGIAVYLVLINQVELGLIILLFICVVSIKSRLDRLEDKVKELEENNAGNL